MNLFDYMNLVCKYIINKIEDKKEMTNSMEFFIKPVSDPYTEELFYEVSEINDNKKQMFYLKFPCSNKEDFYVSVRSLLIEYIKNNDLLMYSATSGDDAFYKTFSIVTNNRVIVNFLLEDKEDFKVFEQFKDYLNTKLYSGSTTLDFYQNEKEEVTEETEEVVTLNKIRLN